MLFSALALTLAFMQPPETPVQPAPQPSRQATQGQASDEANLDEVICRREHVVGSNRPQRICQTRRQWNALRERTLDDLNSGRGRTVESHLPTAGTGR